VGTGYIVILLFRCWARLVAVDDPNEALVTAIAKVKEVVASEAATVMATFADLLVASFGELRTLAPSLIVGIATMLATALTLVPAVAHLLGGRLRHHRGRVPIRDPGSDPGLRPPVPRCSLGQGTGHPAAPDRGHSRGNGRSPAPAQRVGRTGPFNVILSYDPDSTTAITTATRPLQ
jgi:hypothetical protein